MGHSGPYAYRGCHIGYSVGVRQIDILDFRRAERLHHEAEEYEHPQPVRASEARGVEQREGGEEGTAESVKLTFWIFAVIFTGLLIAEISIMLRYISSASKSNIETPKH